MFISGAVCLPTCVNSGVSLSFPPGVFPLQSCLCEEVGAHTETTVLAPGGGAQLTHVPASALGWELWETGIKFYSRLDSQGLGSCWYIMGPR